MNRSKRTQAIAVIAIVLLMLLTLVGASFAQGSASFRLERSVVAGNGGRSTSANFVVSGTIGQAAATPPTAASANYRVSGGFWQNVSAKEKQIYLPFISGGP